MRNLRGDRIYPGAYRRVVIRQNNLRASGLSADYDWLEVRQLKGRDFVAVEKLRLADREWLEPWEANAPPGSNQAISLEEYIKDANRAARTGQGLYFSILPEGRLAGQIALSSVHRGAAMSAVLGYWINSRFAGRGLMPIALAMLIDWCFSDYGLHRLEINIRPENQASLRVVGKLGLREEGLKKNFLYIDQHWCDHRSFAITTEEWQPGLLLDRLVR